MSGGTKWRCWNCNEAVTYNHLRMLDDAEYDDVVDWFGLIHISGPDDQFEADGTVVICEKCCLLGIS